MEFVKLIKVFFLGWFNYQFAICFSFFLLILLTNRVIAARLAGKNPVETESRVRQIAFMVWALILVWFISACVYVFSANYMDHLEATVSAITLTYLEGQPLYPNPSSNPYGSLYGPWLFWMNSVSPLILKAMSVIPHFGNSAIIPGLKLPGLVVLLISVLIWRRFTMRSLTRHTYEGSIVAFFIVMAVLPFGVFAIWNRAEPYLLLLSVVLTTTLSNDRGVITAIWIGAIAGLMSGLKIHGLLYALPAAVLYLTTRPRAGIVRSGMLMIVVGAAVMFLPFAVNLHSLYSYVDYLRLSSKHALLGILLINNLLFTACILLPLMAARRDLGGSSQNDRAAITSLLLSIILVLAIGSKEGSGPHHLIPFVPFAVFFFLRPQTYCASTRPCFAGLWVYLAAACIAFLPSVIVFSLQVRQSSFGTASTHELSLLLDKFPNSQVGPSDATHYNIYYLRVIQVWRNGQLSFDAGAYMDLLRSGVSEEGLRQNIQLCEVRTWILPKGDPWSMENYYDNSEMFSDELRNEFRANYVLVAVERHFDVWQCRK